MLRLDATRKKGLMENSSNSKKFSIKQAFLFCSHAKHSEIFACEQKNLSLNDRSKKIASKTQIADFII